MTGSNWVGARTGVMPGAAGMGWAQGYPDVPVRVIFLFIAGEAGIYL